ncbi:MAG: diphosphomevalonate decarboxylase [Candidatus Woesearchaeota archaeon]
MDIYMMKATAIANSNIAFLKYWGKQNEELNLPMNPSISMTLDENLSTKTTVEFSKDFLEDELILNGKKEEYEKLERVKNFLDIIRKKANIFLKAKVFSENSFPTGSGIASSASGFAALAAASTKALGLKLSLKELSELARLGSGSACRSIYSGFVEWQDYYSVQIKDEKHWQEIRDIIVLISDGEKEISSRQGMKLTKETSEKYKERLSKINLIYFKIKRAIINKDFVNLAEAIMKESDNLNECFLDTKPSLKYLNEKSYEIIKFIKQLNSKKIKAAYTFDAGANAHIITLEQYVPEITIELKRKNFNFLISKPGKGVRYL